MEDPYIIKIERSNGIDINIGIAIVASIMLNKALNNIFYENNIVDKDDNLEERCYLLLFY